MKEIAEALVDAARKGQRVLVLCHPNADPDAVGSSVVLADVLGKFGARALVGVSEGVSRAAKQVLKKVNREIAIDPPSDADLVVLVDTSSLEHLGKLGESLKLKPPRIFLIDHHRPIESMRGLAERCFVDEESTSESELILRLIRAMGAGITPEQASLLLAGIVADTGWLRLAKNSTFEAIEWLVEAGADYQQVMEMLRLPEDLSKRIAMLKAAQRVELHTIHGRLVVFSELGSFEADAAAMLVRTGADVAFVGSEEKGKFRLSARARPEACTETNLHLGQLMLGFAKRFEGTGGGHAGAASVSGKGELRQVKCALLEELKEFLEPKA